MIEFPEGYVRALTDEIIEQSLPNLRPSENFEFSSLQDEDYNCVAWASGRDDGWTQFYDASGRAIRTPERYVQHFLEMGYDEVSPNGDFENGINKIAIYINTNRNHFKHVARQLPNGKWASKLGDWEDIEHSSAEDLLGFYGDKIIYLQKII